MVNSMGELLSQMALAFGSVAILAASSHAILFESNSRKAICWTALIWFLPILGAAFYLIKVTANKQLKSATQKVKQSSKRILAPRPILTYGKLKPLATKTPALVGSNISGPVFFNDDSGLDNKTIQPVLKSFDLASRN